MNTRITGKGLLAFCASGILGAILGGAACTYYGHYNEQVQFEAHMLAAASALREENIEDAKFHWHVAISLNERRYGPYLNLAEVYVREQKPELALRMFERALAHTEYRQEGIHGAVDAQIVDADRRLISEELTKLKTAIKLPPAR